MNAPRLSRTALIVGVTLGLATAAPAWADGPDDGFGPAAAIVGLAAAAVALPYVLNAPRVVVAAPVYAPPPPVYAYTPPAYGYAYAAPSYGYAPRPVYRGRRAWGWEQRDRRWHGDERADDR